ncbi:MAG: hypothetical protein QHJ82_03015, partial [Verrucomicrobiota bacterium]|nr:hypothetical protein [Verrucomicrobiota bacterium]
MTTQRDAAAIKRFSISALTGIGQRDILESDSRAIMRAVVLTCVSLFLAPVRGQVVISPGAGPYSGAYGGGGYGVGAVVPGVNVAAGGAGGFFNGGGFQAGGGRGIYGVTRRTFMGDANVVAARYFASGGVNLPVQSANGFSGQQGYVSAGNSRMRQGYASRLATRTAPQPAVAPEKPDQNLVVAGQRNLNGAAFNRQPPVHAFTANRTTAVTPLP